VSELGGGTAGWQPDPFGRHELRFHDGSGWTPYVRDGEEHALDEPVGTMGATAAPASPLLTAERLRVLPYGAGRERTVHDEHGVVLGQLRTGVQRATGGLRAMLASKEEHKKNVLELADGQGTLLVTLLSPISDPKGTLVVRDGTGRDLGRIVQGTVLGPASVRLAEVVPAEDGGARVLDVGGTEVAVVTRDGTALDVRVVQPLDEPLRTVLVAAVATYQPA
jgi:hypothetical protein